VRGGAGQQQGVAINKALLSTRRCYQQGVAINKALLSTRRCYQQGVAINKALLHLAFADSC
jgi:hypothetical protein